MMTETNVERILVVDDEPGIRRLLCRWLESDGYSCSVAESAIDARRMIDGGGFDVVITDVVMPEVSGIELVADIKARYGRDIAVIVITGVNDLEAAMQALEHGAYQYLNKPFKKNEVLVAVAGAVQRRALERRVDERMRNLEHALRRQSESNAREMETIAQRETGTGPPDRSPSGEDETTSSRTIARQASDLVRRRFAAPDCSTASIAGALGVSETHLCHAYREHWQTTIGRDLRILRMARARELLETTDLMLKAVAAESGYRTKSYRAFLNAFVQETGMTPSFYRQICGGADEDEPEECSEAADRAS